MCHGAFFKTKNEEYPIIIDNKKVYFVDYLLTDKIIEFNGDYWHANPATYNEDAIFKFPNGCITAREIWDRDTIRLNKIKNEGYDILIIWERDFINNKDATIQQCKSFLGII